MGWRCTALDLYISVAGDSQVNQLKDSRVKASDFEVKAVVGRGHFGEVAVVAEKRTGKIFAMKTMKKGDILRQSDVWPHPHDHVICVTKDSLSLGSLFP